MTATARLSISLPKSHLRDLEAVARLTRRSVAFLVRDAVSVYLDLEKLSPDDRACEIASIEAMGRKARSGGEKPLGFGPTKAGIAAAKARR